MSNAFTFFRCFESGIEIIVFGFSVQAPSRVSVETEPTPLRNVRLVLILFGEGYRIQIEDVGSIQIAIDPCLSVIIRVISPLLKR